MQIQSLNNVQSATYGQGAATPKPAVDDAVAPSFAADAKEAVSSEKLQDMVDKMSKTIQTIAQDLQFSVDKETGSNVVKVVDKQTKEVIRQIPSEEMLAISKRLDELSGVLIQQKA